MTASESADSPEPIHDVSMLLDDQLCFALYSATHSIQRRYRPLLKSLGLTYPQYLVLLVLWEHDELTVTEVADRLFLDPATVTPLLKRMEAAGLIERRRGTSDERTVAVSTTTKAQDLKPAVQVVTDRVTCAAHEASSAPEALTRSLQDLRARLAELD